MFKIETATGGEYLVLTDSEHYVTLLCVKSNHSADDLITDLNVFLNKYSKEDISALSLWCDNSEKLKEVAKATKLLPVVGHYLIYFYKDKLKEAADANTGLRVYYPKKIFIPMVVAASSNTGLTVAYDVAGSRASRRSTHFSTNYAVGQFFGYVVDSGVTSVIHEMLGVMK